MKYSSLIVLYTLLIAASAPSCKSREEPVPAIIAGKGGSATIVATPKHHSKYIDSCTIYIKYNTSDLPSTVFDASKYDEAVKCIKVNDTVYRATFTGLKKGKYYLFGKGWDKNIMAEVVGGTPFTINADSTSYNVVVPVTEGD